MNRQDEIKEMDKAIMALYLQVPKEVADSIKKVWENVRASQFPSQGLRRQDIQLAIIDVFNEWREENGRETIPAKALHEIGEKISEKLSAPSQGLREALEKIIMVADEFYETYNGKASKQENKIYKIATEALKK